MHYPESRFYIRRVRLSSDADVLGPLRDAGYRLVRRWFRFPIITRYYGAPPLPSFGQAATEKHASPGELVSLLFEPHSTACPLVCVTYVSGWSRQLKIQRAQW